MKELVKQLILQEYLKTPRIIEAFLAIDRKDFVSEDQYDEAYWDIALPIGYGQTISQPATVAFMLELLQPKEGDNIMDVGAGSCWQTALLAHIVGAEGKVYAVERICPLLEESKKRFAKYGFTNTTFFCRDATKGFPEYAPFDKIIAAASGHAMIKQWQKEVKVGGRIVMPIEESIWLYIKRSETEFEKQEYPGFMFVPLIEERG
ncbi:MAG: protein-L-isoaspartate O-methyltransferase [Patescibacteria group bacterium]